MLLLRTHDKGLPYQLTLFRLGIGDLQVELGRLAQSLLLHNRPLEVGHGDVQAIEGDGVKVQRTLELVVDGHGQQLCRFARPLGSKTLRNSQMRQETYL